MAPTVNGSRVMAIGFLAVVIGAILYVNGSGTRFLGETGAIVAVVGGAVFFLGWVLRIRYNLRSRAGDDRVVYGKFDGKRKER